MLHSCLRKYGSSIKSNAFEPWFEPRHKKKNAIAFFESERAGDLDVRWTSV